VRNLQEETECLSRNDRVVKASLPTRSSSNGLRSRLARPISAAGLAEREQRQIPRDNRRAVARKEEETKGWPSLVAPAQSIWGKALCYTYFWLPRVREWSSLKSAELQAIL
jgi:hypothetical protein